MIFHNTKLINLWETAVSLLFFFVLLIVLFGGFAPPAAWQTSAVFFMVFVQSKHQQILHFDFESSDAFSNDRFGVNGE